MFTHARGPRFLIRLLFEFGRCIRTRLSPQYSGVSGKTFLMSFSVCVPQSNRQGKVYARIDSIQVDESTLVSMPLTELPPEARLCFRLFDDGFKQYGHFVCTAAAFRRALDTHSTTSRTWGTWLYHPPQQQTLWFNVQTV
jgi:hypothetical protein